MMIDREAWISVFNAALTAGINHCRQTLFHRKPKLFYDGIEVVPTVWARMIADKAMENAPEDKP